MKGSVLAVLVGTTILVTSVVPLSAHHSFAAEFDAAKQVNRAVSSPRSSG